MVNMDDPTSTLVQLIQTVPLRRAGKDTVKSSEIGLTTGSSGRGTPLIERSRSLHCWESTKAPRGAC